MNFGKTTRGRRSGESDSCGRQRERWKKMKDDVGLGFVEGDKDWKGEEEKRERD